MKVSRSIGISAAERETGILKETLRMWERRYGFPRTDRSASGDRAYSLADIDKLRLIKRLLEQGLRPAALVSKPIEQLRKIEQSLASARFSGDNNSLPNPDLLRAGQIDQFRIWLQDQAQSRDLKDFILGTVRPLCETIGIAWQTGDIAIFEEHLLTQQIADVLRGLITDLRAPAAQWPRMILTTLPNERHSLGLLMLECVLVANGIYCLSLGSETPIDEIVPCTANSRGDVVALSFSAHYPPRRVRSDLRELRALLPDTVAILAGGAAIRRISTKLPGILLVPEINDVLDCLESLRTTAAS